MTEVLTSIVQNFTLVLAAIYVFSLVAPRLKSSTRITSLVTGLLFGGFGILSMASPIELMDGVLIDTRGIIVLVSASQNGWIGGVTTAIVMSVYRLRLGGAGMTGGLSGIWVTMLVGLVFRVWLKHHPQRSLRGVFLSYFLIGVLIAFNGVAAYILLPPAAREFMFANTTIPIFLTYPLMSGLLAAALYQQQTYQSTQHELAEERALLRTLIDNVPDYIFAKDKNLRFIATNLAHAQAANAESAEALIGKTAYAFFPPELAAQYEEDDHRILSGQVVINQERHSINSEGRPIVVSTTKVPVRAKDGSIIGVIGISRDITEQKLREEQARELEIAQHHTTLLQSFIQNISHDFRTPLSLISTNTYLVGRDNDAEQRGQRLKKVAEQVDHLSKLLNDIEEIIRLDTDSVTMRLMPEKIGQLVRNAVDTCSEMAKEHDQVIRVNVESETLEALADAHYLQSAIRQLIVNAITFTPSHGTITVQTTEQHNSIVISVQDTGQGIAPQDQAHIFERMYRGDKARSIVTGGSGLGLPIVKKIVEAHHGSVTFESALNVGSTFQIVLPIDPVRNSETLMEPTT